MPSLDRTFSDKDVIRIICNNLTQDEKNRVIRALRSNTVCDQYEPDTCLDGSITELEGLQSEMVTVGLIIQTLEDLLNSPLGIIITRNPALAGFAAALQEVLELLREWLENSSAILDNVIIDLLRCKNGNVTNSENNKQNSNN